MAVEDGVQTPQEWKHPRAEGKEDNLIAVGVIFLS